MHRRNDTNAIYNSVDDINLRVEVLEESQKESTLSNKIQRRHTSAHLARHDDAILKCEEMNDEARKQIQNYENKNVQEAAKLRKTISQAEKGFFDRTIMLQHGQEQLTKRVEAGEMRSTTAESKLQEHEGKLVTVIQSQSDISQRLQLVEETTKAHIPALCSDVKSIFERISESDQPCQEEQNDVESPNQLPFDQEMWALGQVDGFVPSSEPQGPLVVDNVEFDIPLHLSNVPLCAGCTVPINAPYDVLPDATPTEIHHPLSTVSPFSPICASKLPSSAMIDLESPDDFRYHQDTTGFSGAFIQPSPTETTEEVCGPPAGAIAKIQGYFKSLNCHASAMNAISLSLEHAPLEDWAIVVLSLPWPRNVVVEYAGTVAFCAPLGHWATVVATHVLPTSLRKKAKSHHDVVILLTFLLGLAACLILRAEHPKPTPPPWSMGDGYAVRDIYLDNLIYV